MKNKIYYILPLLFLFIVSCNIDSSDKNVKEDVVYFGGNIINPSCDVVKLSKMSSYSDTLYSKLDKNNFFLFKLDSLDPGLYSFTHGEEFQYVYLEKQDSLMLRVNTLEFDESLVFTGKGAAVNNYLIKRYLHNENNNINLLQLFSLDFKDFNNAIDSLKKVETKILRDYNYQGSNFSQNALDWANDVLKYTEYSFKELYPYNNTIINKKDSLTKVDSLFYSYRTTVDINDSTNFDNSYFMSFINSRMTTMSLDSILKVIPETDYFKDYKKYDFQYNKIKTYYIESTFTNKKIKNYLFYRYAKELFDNEFSVNQLNDLLAPFFENVSNERMTKRINHMLSRYIKLTPGSKAPDFKVYDGKNHKLFSSYFGKPIYLYFWLSQDRYTWNNDYTKNYNLLKKQYPNIQFISVYLDYTDTWKENIKLSGANGIQLNADYNVVKEKYLIPFSNSFVLIDKHGKIVEANASWPGSSSIKSDLDKLK